MMVDLRQFLRFSRIEFVRKSHENGDVYTFAFKQPNRLRHTAGQHGIFFLPGFRGVHIFSLSSAPEEKYVTISTHVRPGSRYKQRLNSLQPGDKMTMIGPVMNFTLKRAPSRVVFLAQGIGITPFRSMLIHNTNKGGSRHITLIHVAQPPHTFRDITKSTADEAYYPTRPDEFSKEITAAVRRNDYKARYYISGSPSFTSTARKSLLALGVPKKAIRRDSFLGY